MSTEVSTSSAVRAEARYCGIKVCRVVQRVFWNLKALQELLKELFALLLCEPVKESQNRWWFRKPHETVLDVRER